MMDARLPQLLPAARIIVRSALETTAASLAEGIAAHRATWPNGDWRAANEQIGAARQTIGLLFPETVGMGNAEALFFLRARLGAQ